ncbi:putative ribonuclease H-like domain-containing protein [Tanacetum coccineum]
MFDSSSKNSYDDEPQLYSNAEKKDDKGVSKESGFSDQEKPESSTPNINTAWPSINTVSANSKTGSLNINTVSPTVITTRSNRSQNVSDMFSLVRSATLEATYDDLFDDETEMDMSNLTTSIKRMTKNINEHGFISAVYKGKTHEDLHTCLFVCFLSQEEPKRIAKALSGPTWVEVIQEELLQFKLQKVWILVDLPKGKRAIGTKWIFRNKKDERGIVTRNKARLVAQGYTQEEGIDYDKGFAPMVRIKTIRLFLAYASFMGFMVYQMDVRCAFLFWSMLMTLSLALQLGYWEYLNSEKLMHDKFQIVLWERTQFLLRFAIVEDSSRLNGYEKLSQRSRYLKGQPKLGLWYLRNSPFDLVAYSDSDYAGASLDRKSTTGGYQFLGYRLISWQCKKQTVVATSSTEVEYMAAASCYGQFWQTASTTTLKDGEVEITTTIDGQLKTITEASLRRHLKLEDADGISSLPNTEIFEQLALMGVPTPPHDSSLLGGHTPGSDEGRMQQTELIDLVIKLSDKVLAFETDLQQTKQVYSTAVTKLILRVKRLEKIVKSSKARRRAKIVVSDDEKVSADSSKQGRMIDNINQDSPAGLVQENTSSSRASKDKGKVVITESDPEQTASKLKERQERAGYEAAIKLHEQLDQEESHRIARDAEIALRLQEEIDAAGRHRMAKVHQATQGFTEDEWENIRERVEADEELAQKLQAEEREKYSEVDQAKMLVDLINQRKRFFAQQKAEAKRNKPMT